MGREQDNIHGQEDLCSKQLENTRANPARKLQSSRYRTFRITKNAWVNQEELLVARNQKQHQEICSRMHQMPTK